MSTTFRLGAFAGLLLILYLLAWPVEVHPMAWQAPPNPGYTGNFAANEFLDAVLVRFAGHCLACEDIAIDRDGQLYGGTVTGELRRFRPGEQTGGQTLAHTGGRPLGLDFDTLGRLYIADAQRGLLRFTPGHTQLETLSTAQGGRPYRFTDDVEVAPDGLVYFTDASDRFGIANYKLDILEHQPHGRLLVYDPASKQVSLLLDSLYFANGVAVSAANDFVLVCETSAYRVTRYWLRGPQQGQREIFIDHLPGFPDGISRGEDGIFWLALVSPRNQLLDRLAGSPFWRRLIARLPAWAQPAPEAHPAVIGLNAAGQVVANFQSTDAAFQQVTSIQQWGDLLFLGSLQADGIGVLPRSR